MATPANNPLDGTHLSSHPAVSSKTITIAGILTTVYGIDELPSNISTVSCLWLLHPRLQTQKTMAPIAAQTILAWNSARGKSTKGLIAVSFDQRNHGSRQVDKIANEAWRQGNPRHAQDMFSSYHGTAMDTSTLITYLPSYILSTPRAPPITQHLVLGVSLGGHASWHCILHDPRITAAVVGIGCPDYTRLMTDRAAKSKLSSWTSSTPPGATFLGSQDFPKALLDAVAKYDPSGLLLLGVEPETKLSSVQKQKFQSLLKQHLNGKSILNLSGAVDKLVPYAAGEPFLKQFKEAIQTDQGLDIIFEDTLFDGVGHAFPKAMADKATQWICAFLSKDQGASVAESKI